MRDAATYRNLAEKFRKLAEQASDEGTAAHLRDLAAEYEEQAKLIEPDAEPPMPQA